MGWIYGNASRFSGVTVGEPIETMIFGDDGRLKRKGLQEAISYLRQKRSEAKRVCSPYCQRRLEQSWIIKTTENRNGGSKKGTDRRTMTFVDDAYRRMSQWISFNLISSSQFISNWWMCDLNYSVIGMPQTHRMIQFVCEENSQSPCSSMVEVNENTDIRFEEMISEERRFVHGRSQL